MGSSLNGRPALVCVLILLVGCAGHGVGPVHPVLDTDEIVRLKMALEGKKPDGTALTPEDPEFVSPEEAQKRLDEMLSRINPKASRGPSGVRRAEGTTAPAGRPLPAILGAGEATLVGDVRSSDGGGYPCRLIIEATGVPLDYWGGGLGVVKEGRFRLSVPAGAVKVRAACGVFRPVVERSVNLAPGRKMNLACTVSRDLPALKRIGVKPCRLVFKTTGLGNESGRVWRERVRLLEEVEGAEVLAVDGPEAGVPEGTMRAAAFPPWPGYGRYLVLDRTGGLGGAMLEWRGTKGKSPCGSFLAREEPSFVGCIPERESFLTPGEVYGRWPLLEEVFGRTGLFDLSRPSELPFLALSGRVRHVFFDAGDLPERFVEMLGLCRGFMPLLHPEPWQAWPDVLVPADAPALQSVVDGRYTIGNGLYVWGTLEGRLPGQSVPVGARTLQAFVFTGALCDAGISRLDVFYNGRLVQRAKGTHNQVFMTVTVGLDLDQPGWVVLYAEGSAREDAQRRIGQTVLKALSAPFIVGERMGAIATRVHIKVADASGLPVEGARVFAGGGAEAGRTDAWGVAEVASSWGGMIRVEHGGRSADVSPWCSAETAELMRLGQSGQPSVWDVRYWRRADVLLRRRDVQVVLRGGGAGE